MGSFSFWQKWLTAANVITLLVGLLAAFAPDSFVFDMHVKATRQTFFAGEAIPDHVQHMRHWLLGIIGGTIVGFHTLMIFISENAFKQKQNWAWYACWAGLLSWFVIDSSLSFYHGAAYNVYLINSVALFLIGLPLLMSKRYFPAKSG